MNRKLALIFLIFITGLYLLLSEQKKNEYDKKYSSNFTQSSRKVSPTKLKKHVAQKTITKARSLGNISRKGNVSRNSLNFISDLPKVENQFLKSKKIKLVKGIFASHRPIKNKRLLGEHRSFFIYERHDELENVFISEETSNIMFWSGEVLLSGRALDEVVEGIAGVEIVKNLNNFLIIRFSNTSDIIQYLDVFMSDRNIESIELDLKSQRRVKI